MVLEQHCVGPDPAVASIPSLCHCSGYLLPADHHAPDPHPGCDSICLLPPFHRWFATRHAGASGSLLENSVKNETEKSMPFRNHDRLFLRRQLQPALLLFAFACFVLSLSAQASTLWLISYELLALHHHVSNLKLHADELACNNLVPVFLICQA